MGHKEGGGPWRFARGRWRGTCNAPTVAAILAREVVWKITELKVDVAWRRVCCIFMKAYNKALHSASRVEARGWAFSAG